MRILVLGAGGMLGHKLLQRLGRVHDVAGTIRSERPDAELARAVPGGEFVCGVSVDEPSTVVRAMDAVRPEVVVNRIGIIKQLKESKDPVPSIAVNALFPHQMARLCASRGARLIHFSTDCVFSGRGGNYTEDDVPDCSDLYGRTKLLGEVAGAGCLTLRTSIVGREIRGHFSLIDWFLSQSGKRVKGFDRALYSGLTTGAMAALVADLIERHPEMQGLWHVSGEPISKFELLRLVNQVYGLGVEIDRDEEFFCDRRLDSSRFRLRTGWLPPSWEEMIVRMHQDPTAYSLN